MNSSPSKMQYDAWQSRLSILKNRAEEIKQAIKKNKRNKSFSEMYSKKLYRTEFKIETIKQKIEESYATVPEN